jgi:hypothetical protein
VNVTTPGKFKIGIILFTIVSLLLLIPFTTFFLSKLNPCAIWSHLTNVLSIDTLVCPSKLVANFCSAAANNAPLSSDEN